MANVDRDFIIKRSAELLRAGARMLSSQCPACGSPLFQLKTGEVVCPLHGKVIVVEKEEEVVHASLDAMLIRLEEKVMGRIYSLMNGIDELKERPSVEERRLVKAIKEWLEVVYAARKIRLLKETPHTKEG